MILIVIYLRYSTIQHIFSQEVGFSTNKNYMPNMNYVTIIVDYCTVLTLPKTLSCATNLRIDRLYFIYYHLSYVHELNTEDD